MSFKDKNEIMVVTHDGNFHADEVFAVATLFIWAKKINKTIKLLRTRDENEFEKADILIDVGVKYEPENFRFDHHQKDGAGFHFDNTSLPYASFGLVWKHFGEEICGDKNIAQKIEKRLVIPIDLRDNGINLSKNIFDYVSEYSVAKDMIFAFRPTWQEGLEKSDQNFFEIVNIFKQIIDNEIKLVKSMILAEKIVLEEIKKQSEPEILILEQKIPFDDVVKNFKNIKIVVYPENGGSIWVLESAKDDPTNFSSDRVKFPKNWCGLRGDELAKVSSVPEAIFCHKNGFLATTKSKDSVILMAKKVLDQP